MTLVCFDTETTGLDVQKEHIIQLSLVKFDTDNWQVIDQRDWYILPEGEFSIPAEAEAVHHISKDFLLENGVSLRGVYEELTAFTDGCDMLSYNGNGYDAPILYYNLKRLGLKFDFEDRTWYDALVLERIHTAGKVDENGERLVLNAVLNQRSNDVLTANNWNVAQYAILLMMMAQVSDMVPGELVHMIADAHIYDRHIPLVKDLIARQPLKAPRVWLDPDVTDFYAFTTDSLHYEDYETHGQIRDIPVAI